MKRFINLFLIVVLSLNVFTIPSSVYAENNTVEDRAYIDFLMYLGVLEDVSESDIGAEVTREDFAYFTAKVAGVSTVGNNDARRFVDVPTYSYAFSAINNIADLNIISQSADGKFRPYEYVTCIEACTMLLNAMGYKRLADNYGMWPYNYHNVLAYLEADVPDFNTVLTLDKAAELIVELIKLPTYRVDGNEYSSSGESLLERTFSIECGEGTVDAFSGGALDSSDIMREKYVKISGEIFEVSEKFDESEFFGNFVEYYYYNESGKEEIVYMVKSKRAEEDLIIDIELFDTYFDGRISYYKDETFKSTKNISLEDEYTIVYNGMPLSKNLANTFEMLNKGSIILKDSNGNGRYDVLLIKDYKNFVVSTYDINNSIAYDKLTAGNKIEFSDKNYVKILMGDKEILCDTLITDNVLSVAMSQDGEIISVLASSNYITGKLESINEDFVKINGEEYKIEKSYQESFDAEVGAEYVFHLDSFGNIAYVSKADARRMKYAYLIKGIIDEDDDSYSLKMLTEDNKIEKLEVAEKVTIDADRFSETEKIKKYFLGADGKFKPQLIEYATNSSGEITEIDTLLVKNDDEDSDYSLRAVFTGVEPEASWWGQSGRYMFKAILRTQIVTFMIPSEADADDKYYRIASSWQESTGTTAVEWWEDVNMYYRSDDSAYVDVIVKAIPTTVENEQKDVVMVSGVGTAWDEAESKTVTELKGIDSTGSAVTLKVDPEKCDKGIEKGDLIVVSKYMTGETASAKSVYDAGDGGEPKGFISTKVEGVGEYLLLSSGSQVAKYRHETQISFGYAKKIFDEGIVSMSRYLGGEETERMVFPSAVAVYDSKTGEVYSGSIADCLSYEAVGDACSKLFYNTRAGVGKGMFIYK